MFLYKLQTIVIPRFLPFFIQRKLLLHISGHKLKFFLFIADLNRADISIWHVMTKIKKHLLWHFISFYPRKNKCFHHIPCNQTGFICPFFITVKPIIKTSAVNMKRGKCCHLAGTQMKTGQTYCPETYAA